MAPEPHLYGLESLGLARKETDRAARRRGAEARLRETKIQIKQHEGRVFRGNAKGFSPGVCESHRTSAIR
jgi:hypothetical protein